MNVKHSLPINELPAWIGSFVPEPLDSNSLTKLLVSGREGGPAAARAAAALRALFRDITSSDLQRLVINQTEPSELLARIEQGATSALQSLRDCRLDAAERLAQDSVTRKQLDAAAAFLLTDAIEEAERNLRTVSSVETESQRQRTALLEAGFSEEQIKTMLASRNVDAIVHARREDAAAAQARATKLEQYLCDPLRDADKLGDELLAQVAARSVAINSR